VKNAKIFQSGEKFESFFKVVKNTNDFSKWFYCNGRPAQVENAKVFAKW